MIAARQAAAALAVGELVVFDTRDPHLLGYLRGSGDERVLCLANYSPREATCEAVRFCAGPACTAELLSGRKQALSEGLRPPAYGVAWLRYPS